MTKTSILMIAGLLNLGTCFSQITENKEEKKEDKKPESEMKERDFQFTFITPIGTNGIDAYKTSNKISVNWLAGLNGGVKGLEVGGFANVIMKDVKGIQAAGFTNVVFRDVRGGQFAGFVNYSGGNLDGAAFAGFCNVNLHSARGGQLAGFVNANMGNFEGAQLSGFANYNNKNMKGVQATGYLNVNVGDVKGAQLAGFANIAAGDVEGAQMSGFFNIARKVKGFQVGFLNVADSVDGASIGFCNIVKKGLHQAEVSADELFYTNLSVRTGTRKFYNIFSAGLSSRPQGTLWQIGYGAGTSFAVSSKLRSDISISAHHISNGLLYHATSELYKFYWGVEYKLAGKCYIAGGPTFNLYWGDALQPDFAKKYSGLAPYSLLNETNTYGFNFKAWIGARVAVRFL